MPTDIATDSYFFTDAVSSVTTSDALYSMTPLIDAPTAADRLFTDVVTSFALDASRAGGVTWPSAGLRWPFGN